MSTATGPARRRRSTAVPALALAAALALAGCAGGAEPGDAATDATATAPDPAATTSGPPATPAPSVSATGSPSPATGAATAATGTPSPGGVAPTSGATRALAGGLVEGFPTDLVPVPVGAEVTASSVVEGEGTRQVSLSGRSTTAAAELLSFWRGALTAQGFTELPGSAPEGTVRATFVRGGGAELLDVSVLSGEGGQTFTVGGQIAG